MPLDLWKIIYMYTHTILHLLTGWDDRTLCFHCGWGLQDWLNTGEPWNEHAAWFPYCVYIQYIRRGVMQHITQNSKSWSCTLM